MSLRTALGSRIALVAGFTLALLGLSGAKAQAQVPVLYYDFENNTTRATFENLVEQQVNAVSAAITRTGGITTVTGVAGAGTFNLGAAAGQAATGNTWSSATTDPGIAATDYYQCTVNSTGLAGLSVSIDDQASATGPARVGVIAAVGAGPFIALAPAAPTGNNAFASSTFDLSSFSALDNQAVVTIRVYAYASTGAVGLLEHVQAGGAVHVALAINDLAGARNRNHRLLSPCCRLSSHRPRQVGSGVRHRPPSLATTPPRCLPPVICPRHARPGSGRTSAGRVDRIDRKTSRARAVVGTSRKGRRRRGRRRARGGTPGPVHHDHPRAQRERRGQSGRERGGDRRPSRIRLSSDGIRPRDEVCRPQLDADEQRNGLHDVRRDLQLRGRRHPGRREHRATPRRQERWRHLDAPDGRNSDFDLDPDHGQ